MIAPIWDARPTVADGWTSFQLDLSARTNRADLVSDLDDIKPSLLLFLNKLHTIRITVDGRTTEMTKATLPGDVTRLQKLVNQRSVQSDDYLVYSTSVVKMPDDDKRSGVSKSVITLAFPITRDGEPSIQDRDVHAFLPLRSYGFSVSH